jgi:hypothetical protein
MLFWVMPFWLKSAALSFLGLFFGIYFGCLGFPELEVFRVALCEQVFLFRLVKERGFGVWPDTDAFVREFWRLVFSLNCECKVTTYFWTVQVLGC